MKKEYIEPEIDAFELQCAQNLLSGSNVNEKTPDDDDAENNYF